MIVMAVLLALAVCGRVKADYLPVLEVGRTWIVGEREFGTENDVRFIEVAVVERAVVAGLDAFKIRLRKVEKTDGVWNVVENASPSAVFYGYEENGNVYSVDEATGTKYLFISMDPDNPMYHKPDIHRHISLDLNVAGKNRKCICFPDLMVNFNTWIVEGIGTSVYIKLYRPISSPGEKSYDYYMAECRQDGEPIFTKDDFDSLMQYVSVDNVASISPGCGEEHPLYDIHGKCVDAPRPGEIYVSEGKKIMFKR